MEKELLEALKELGLALGIAAYYIGVLFLIAWLVVRPIWDKLLTYRTTVNTSRSTLEQKRLDLEEQKQHIETIQAQTAAQLPVAMESMITALAGIATVQQQSHAVLSGVVANQAGQNEKTETLTEALNHHDERVGPAIDKIGAIHSDMETLKAGVEQMTAIAVDLVAKNQASDTRADGFSRDLIEIKTKLSALLVKLFPPPPETLAPTDEAVKPGA